MKLNSNFFRFIHSAVAIGIMLIFTGCTRNGPISTRKEFISASLATELTTELHKRYYRPSTVQPVAISGDNKVKVTYQLESQSDAETHFGATFADLFYCIKITIIKDTDSAIKVDSASLNIPIRYIQRISRSELYRDATAVADPSKIPDMLPESDYTLADGIVLPTHNINLLGDREHTYSVWSELRNPMDFSAVLDTFNHIQRDDPNAFFVRMLRRTGIIASAAGTFISGKDYGEVVSFFQGPITEQLAEELLADLIAHLNFLNQHALHEETIISSDDVAVQKYVFFPRTDIIGRFGLDIPIRIMDIDSKEEYLYIEATKITGTSKIDAR